jgi:tRNA1Val (adenine37-N6)-methyltransferase
MSNHYFQFKQFRVEQDHCAMKVSTDACIQGAWAPVSAHVKRVLDIGAGTGLLSLMLAQRYPGILIDAIELDSNAARQAKDNCDASSWANRLSVVQGDVRTHCFSARYDLIICNPPFFTNSLLGDTPPRNIARHTLSLTYPDLLDSFKQLLSDDGYACIMLPPPEYGQWHALLQQNDWHIQRELFVKATPAAAPNRIISLCSRAPAINVTEETLIIRNSENGYTPAFKALLAAYYLQL